MGIDKSLSDDYPSVIIGGTRYHYGRDPAHGYYLVENAAVAKDYWWFTEKEDLVAFLVNLPETADRGRIRRLYPDWREVTDERRIAYRAEDRSRLRALAAAKIEAGTATRFDMDLDGRRGPHAPQRLARAGVDAGTGRAFAGNETNDCREKRPRFEGPPVSSEGRQESRSIEDRRGRSDDDGNLQVRTRKWTEGRMRHVYGVWNERSGPPRVGQLVNFTDGMTPRGEVGERLVTPLTPLRPGEGTTRRYVIVELHPGRPGFGRIVGDTRLREEAVRMARERDEARLLEERSGNPREMRPLRLDPKLRKDLGRPI